MEQLGSSDPSARGAAKLELIRSADPATLPLLLKEMPLIAGPTQTAMVEVLAAYKDVRKIPVLLAVAPKANVESQLVDLGAPAAQAMMQSLKANCDPYDTGLYTEWVGNTMAEMPKIALPLFVAALRDGNSCQQSAAEDGLQRAYAQPEYGLIDPTINLFIEAVESDDALIHMAAGKWIDSFGDKVDALEFEGVVEVLIAAYRNHAPPATMVAIAQMLAGAPRPRVTRFMNAARHAPNPEIRRIAEQYSANYESSASSGSESREVDPLAARSLQSPDPATRVEAAEALSQSDDALKDTPILVKAMHDPDAKVRAAVVAALGELNGYSNNPRNERERDVSCSVQLADALRNDADPAVRATAAQSLGEVRDFDESVAQVLRAALNDNDQGVIVQAMTTLAARRDAGSAPILADIYHAAHQNAQVKTEALVALVNICDPRTEPVFIEALSDAGEYSVQQGSSGLFCTLQKKADPNAVEPLLKLLPSQPGYNIIRAVGVTRDPRAYEPLLLILASPSPQTRGLAVDALGDLGDKRAVVALGALLKDPTPQVRISAAHALSEMSDFPPPKELLEALHDEDTTVQIWAAAALGKAHDPRAVDALVGATDYNASAIRALGESKDPRAVMPLIAILQDATRKGDARGDVALALGKLGDLRAVDPLIAVLNESDPQMLTSAVQALGKLHDQKAVEPLKQLIRRWETRPPIQQGAVVTFAYDVLRGFGVDVRGQVSGAPH